MDSGDLPAFSTTEQLARRWCLSTRQVRRIIAADEIQVHRIGRSVRISKAAIEAFEALQCADVWPSRNSKNPNKTRNSQ